METWPRLHEACVTSRTGWSQLQRLGHWMSIKVEQWTKGKKRDQTDNGSDQLCLAPYPRSPDCSTLPSKRSHLSQLPMLEILDLLQWFSSDKQRRKASGEKRDSIRQENVSWNSVHKQSRKDDRVRRKKATNTSGFNSSGFNAVIYWGSRQTKLLHLAIRGLKGEYFLGHTVV